MVDQTYKHRNTKQNETTEVQKLQPLNNHYIVKVDVKMLNSISRWLNAWRIEEEEDEEG